MMGEPWENDSCEQVKGYFAYYTVPEAAMLWCGIPPEQIQEHLKHAVPAGEANEYWRHVLKHPYIPCLEPRCRAIQEAINKDKLKVGRDGGESFYTQGQQVAYSRRTVKRNDLKEWMEKEFPTDKPAFLFDEIERKTHPAITVDAFDALQADREAKTTELGSVRQQLEIVTTERDELKSRLDKMTTAAEIANKPPTSTNYQTLLKLVIGMAMDAYQYDPNAIRNPATGENKGSIKTALELKGIKIDADTIRKHLTEAKELL